MDRRAIKFAESAVRGLRASRANPRVTQSVAWHTAAVLRAWEQGIGIDGHRAVEAFQEAAHDVIPGQEEERQILENLGGFFQDILDLESAAFINALRTRKGGISQLVEICAETAAKNLDPNDSRENLDRESMRARGLELAIAHRLTRTELTLAQLRSLLSAGVLSFFESCLREMGSSWNAPEGLEDPNEPDYRTLERVLAERVREEGEDDEILAFIEEQPRMAPHAGVYLTFFVTYRFLLQFYRGRVSARYMAYFTLRRMTFEAKPGEPILPTDLERVKSFATRGGGSNHREIKQSRRLFDLIRNRAS